MAGYLMEPITDNEDFKENVRNIKKWRERAKIVKKKNVVLKGDGSLDLIFVEVIGGF